MSIAYIGRITLASQQQIEDGRFCLQWLTPVCKWPSLKLLSETGDVYAAQTGAVTIIFCEVVDAHDIDHVLTATFLPQLGPGTLVAIPQVSDELLAMVRSWRDQIIPHIVTKK